MEPIRSNIILLVKLLLTVMFPFIYLPEPLAHPRIWLEVVADPQLCYNMEGPGAGVHGEEGGGEGEGAVKQVDE